MKEARPHAQDECYEMLQLVTGLDDYEELRYLAVRMLPFAPKGKPTSRLGK